METLKIYTSTHPRYCKIKHELFNVEEGIINIFNFKVVYYM